MAVRYQVRREEKIVSSCLDESNSTPSGCRLAEIPSEERRIVSSVSLIRVERNSTPSGCTSR